jgi:hypothetical protein
MKLTAFLPKRQVIEAEPFYLFNSCIQSFFKLPG